MAIADTANATSEAPTPVQEPVPVAAPSPPARERVLFTGRRKESVARVRLRPGNGVMTVNRKAYDSYFPRESQQVAIRQPLMITQQLGKFDVVANVMGGGTTGQAGAVRLGIARALAQMDPAYRLILRGAGLLTRDPRMQERKKYGQKGARKRFQWTKR